MTRCERETDLEAIKFTIKLFLDYPVNVDEKYPLITHHPLFKERYYLDDDEMLDITKEEDYEKVKAKFLKGIDKSTDIHVLFFLYVNRPYSGIIFKLVKDYLSNSDYSKLLKDIWCYTEYPNKDKNVSKSDYISLWEDANLQYIYTEEDKKIIEELPSEFIVYRGLMDKASKNGLSWTLSKETAIWFATRFNKRGKVYQAIVNKKDILAYISERNEEEIIIDYTKLKDIREVEY